MVSPDGRPTSKQARAVYIDPRGFEYQTIEYLPIAIEVVAYIEYLKVLVMLVLGHLAFQDLIQNLRRGALSLGIPSLRTYCGSRKTGPQGLIWTL